MDGGFYGAEKRLRQHLLPQFLFLAARRGLWSLSGTARGRRDAVSPNSATDPASDSPTDAGSVFFGGYAAVLLLFDEGFVKNRVKIYIDFVRPGPDFGCNGFGWMIK